MAHWVWKLLTVLSLVASWGVEAAIESVPSTFVFKDGSALGFTATVSSFDAAGCREAEWLLCQKYCPGFNQNLLEPYSNRGGICYNRYANFGAISAACPIPTVNPAVPYHFNSLSLMCERAAQENLTITLQGGSEVEPSNSLSLTAIVINQNDGQPPKNPVNLNISLKVDSTSAGHVHGDGARPRGGIANVKTCPSDAPCWSNPTNGNGMVAFSFNAPAASGTHTITASCDRCTNGSAPKTVNVKVAGLQTIPASRRYALQDSAGRVIGAISGKHSDNHYLTATAIGKLQDLANIYTKINPGAKLYLNDASLVWGGLFDVGSRPWSPPHSAHRRGTELDIRAQNSGPNNEGAVPAALFDKLSKGAKKKGIKAALHCTDKGVPIIGAPCYGIPNNRHFHVSF